VSKINTLQVIFDSRLVAIVRLDDLSCAQELTQSLLSGGIKAIELTLTNSETPQEVERLRACIPEFSTGQAALGVGSVRSLQEARIAINCGAQFLVAPICQPQVIEHAVNAGVVVCPGAYTPTEAALAHSLGADLVKIFPARTLGSGYIKDILAPMPHLKLMPTGGIDLTNLQDYINAGAMAVGVGGQLVNSKWIEQRDWTRVTRVARDYSLCASMRCNLSESD
jgi:2-dehydro-3-deoxyphosphogluconate aldolase/(4S)-4-hydroxy-2-oxoglutarate aldolase